MQAQPAELCVRASHSPAVCENPDTPAFGMARKQERIGVTRAGQDFDKRPRGLAEQHRARAGLRIAKVG